jgi:hypothetical protein
MKFDPLVTYTDMVRNELTVIYRGSDGRYYVEDVDRPGEWNMSCHSFTEAMLSLNHALEFWQEKMGPRIFDNPRTARIDGVHYMVGDEKAGPFMRGFGGSKFHITFNDGRQVTTTNLWCQGDIPKALRDKLPDNAVFTPRVQ